MNTELLKSKLLEAAFNGSLTHANTSTWEDFALGEIFLMKAGKNVTAADISEEQNEKCPYPCYGGNGLRGYVKDYNTEGIFPIIGRQGALCGNVKYVEGKFFATEHAVVVRNKKEVDSRWAFHALTFLNLNQYATATAQPGLAVSKIEQVRLSLPPIAEQQRIVAALEEGFAYIDAVASAKQNLSDTAELLRNKILQAAFDGSLTGADTSTWDWTPMKHVTKIMCDGDWIEKKDQSENGIRLVQTGNVGNGCFIDKPNSYKYISEDTFKRLNCTEIFPGDILFSRLPSPVGRACELPQVNYRMITAVDCTIVRLKEIIDKKFFLYYVQSPTYHYKMAENNFITGTTRARISRSNLEKMPVPLPPLAEQQRIVSKIEELFTQIDKITK